MPRCGARSRASCTRALGRGASPLSRSDELFMRQALVASAQARRRSSPNPWVGCVVVGRAGQIVGLGATEAPGGRHAEVVALDDAGDLARGATAYVTLEPCCHHGRTPPCADRLVSAGVRRVVVALSDPDPRVSGGGMSTLVAAGISTSLGCLSSEVEEKLRPYLVHRTTGRPYVILKLASTFDGRLAAPNGSSRWITSDEARRDAHELRADSGAVMVGAGTVRIDDPELTVRVSDEEAPARQPLRVVLGRVGDSARVRPALEMSGDLRGILDDLGRRGVLQLLVEGGAGVAGEFHRLGLVDRYVFYLAPTLLGGDDGVPVFTGVGAATMGDAWRGSIVEVRRLGADLRIDLESTSGRHDGTDPDASSSSWTLQ
ncbi:MAG: bifunctional diaminohydroxyphosphoribosylaminopyrimidine deaminase/5-amino-6-(5-phosphoribosylamino)uracil reductase RibD [Acidimicrobiales bacterium]